MSGERGLDLLVLVHVVVHLDVDNGLVRGRGDVGLDVGLDVHQLLDVDGLVSGDLLVVLVDIEIRVCARRRGGTHSRFMEI